MSAISSVLPPVSAYQLPDNSTDATTSPSTDITTDPTTDTGGLAQIIQDFASIGSALQSGDVSGAQIALSVFQQNLENNSQTSGSQPFGTNTQANTAYQSLVVALQTGNLTGAQMAFDSLKADLQAIQIAPNTSHGLHHHYRYSASGGSGISSFNAAFTGFTSASVDTAELTPPAATSESPSSGFTPDGNGQNNPWTIDVTA